MQIVTGSPADPGEGGSFWAHLFSQAGWDTVLVPAALSWLWGLSSPSAGWVGGKGSPGEVRCGKGSPGEVMCGKGSPGEGGVGKDLLERRGMWLYLPFGTMGLWQCWVSVEQPRGLSATLPPESGTAILVCVFP